MTAPEFVTEVTADDDQDFIPRRTHLGRSPVDVGAAPSGNAAVEFDIAVVGLGYVGLPTALALHAAGQRVLGVDVSERRLAVISEQRADLMESCLLYTSDAADE